MKSRFLFSLSALSILSISTFSTSCNKEVSLNLKFKNHPISEGWDDPALDIELSEFKKYFSIGDIIELKMKGKNNKDYTVTLPYINEFSEAGYYAPCIAEYNDTFEDNKKSVDISLAMWPFGQDIKTNIFFGQDVKVTMKKKGGYKSIIDLAHCSNKLTYEESGYNSETFSNFRDISTIGSLSKFIKKNVLYRSSAPFKQKDSDSRHLYVNYLMDSNNILYDICISKSASKFKKEIESLPDDIYVKRDIYNNNYYKSFSFGTDFFTTDAAKMVREVLETIANLNSNNLMIHCDEGKDRTGFFFVLLEAFATPTINGECVEINDILADFMISYKNYYNITLSDNINRYRSIRDLTVYRHIYSIMLSDPIHELGQINWLDPKFDVRSKVNEKLENHSLYYYADKYIRNTVGLSEENINKLREKLYVNSTDLKEIVK